MSDKKESLLSDSDLDAVSAGFRDRACNESANVTQVKGPTDYVCPDCLGFVEYESYMLGPIKCMHWKCKHCGKRVRTEGPTNFSRLKKFELRGPNASSE